MSTFTNNTSGRAWNTRTPATTTGPSLGLCYQVTFTQPGHGPASVVHVADHVIGAGEREGLRLELIARFALDPGPCAQRVRSLWFVRVVGPGGGLPDVALVLRGVRSAVAGER